MFDANLIFIDGTVDVDSDTAASFVAATSTTRSATSGAAVLDLKGTAANGMSAVLIIPALTSSTDYLIATIQVSSVVAFGSDVHTMCNFDIAAATTGRILASECGAIRAVIRKFATDKRYARAIVTPTKGTGDGSFSYLKFYLEPFAFKVL